MNKINSICMKEPPDEYYRATKLPLQAVIKHPYINIPKISDAVIRSNKIVIHTLQFMKLYLLDYYINNSHLPVIDKEFITSCLKIVCSEKDDKRGRNPKAETAIIKDLLKKFYNEHYKPLQVDEKLDYTHLNIIFQYLTVDILTMYENNIKLHYVEYVERYVNVMWKKKMLTDKIRKLQSSKKEGDKSISKLCSTLRRIKNDILTGEFKSKSYYHDWIKDKVKHITPNKEKYKKDSIYYDLQCNPMEYLPCMIYMMKEVEKEKTSINNVFPLRNDIIPKHIRLDTTTLVHLLLRKSHGNKTDFLFKGNLKKKEDQIWEFFFRTEKSCFRQTYYSFHHMIETDGISCTILLIRKDLVGRKVRSKKGGNKEQYIDTLTKGKRDELKRKKIVAIDPGKNSILYCVDGDDKDTNKFSYSQNQRRKECKINKYKMIIQELKRCKIYGKTITEYETELSIFNRKSLDIEEYKKYLYVKNSMNYHLTKFYKRDIFRKLKLNGYMNRKRSEQRMINNFKKKFGNNNNVIIAIGDYEQKKHMKFKEPTKGIGMRKLFRSNGYKVYLVDEYRTSCRCSNCEGGECKKFMIKENPKPDKNNQILVHTLLRCKNGCGIWNRDCNGAKNIYKIASNAIQNKKRPEYLSRSNLSDYLHE